MLGKYIYAIVENKNRTTNVNGLFPVSFRHLSALVGDAECKDYQSLPKGEVIGKLTSHQQQIETIMEKYGTVLPVKFGTIVGGEEEVGSVLEKGYPFLWDTLQKMEDKIELDLVCFWNEQKAAQMAFQESKKIRGYYTSEVALSEVEGDSSDGGMESKIALGKLIAQYLETKKEKLSSQILKVLKKETAGSCSHTLSDVNMLLNQAFLVEKENEEVFDDTLDKLDRKFADLVNFRLVGPLPPYSFATVVVEALNKEKVENARRLLNLTGPITKGNVKNVYDKLASKLHPDHGGNPTEFERVTRSYKLLRKYAEHGLVNVYLYKWEDQNGL